ncbi:GIY-YIG nuclease family protein [Rubrivirga sp.]|uniref:GIY-YIG nuclease family protein n=1 Tax=Rubrivirga sp. TaxID=1885344 RepID=UPI003C70C60F
MTVPPATIRLFLPFGDPTRLRTAELSNWSGKALAAPRSDLEALFARSEVQRPGVYLLTGVDPRTGETVVYIGEVEVIRSRLKQHASKEFWNRVIVFVSKDENLTKAHIRYLEGALIQEASDVGRVRIDNAQSSGSRLPESDRADMDVYLSKIRQLLPVLGSVLLSAPPSRATSSPTREFSTSIRGLSATGQPSSGGFTVFSGSQAFGTHRPSASRSVVGERERLVAGGRLDLEDGHLVFCDDVEFSSPSMAASVVKGGNTNGLKAWALEDGTSLKDLEQQSVTAFEDA